MYTRAHLDYVCNTAFKLTTQSSVLAVESQQQRRHAILHQHQLASSSVKPRRRRNVWAWPSLDGPLQLRLLPHAAPHAASEAWPNLPHRIINRGLARDSLANIVKRITWYEWASSWPTPVGQGSQEIVALYFLNYDEWSLLHGVLSLIGNARLFIILFVRKFGRVCSQFWLSVRNSVWGPLKRKSITLLVRRGGSRGTKIVNKHFVNKLVFPT